MKIYLDLYRRDVRVSEDPLVRLSAIGISPERPARTIVFIHGFGGYADQWINQLQELSLQNHVIALDQRGHGYSEKPYSSYTMDEIQADLEKSLEILEVEEKFVLVGHSFGGAVVTEYATTHPERIEQLILTAIMMIITHCVTYKALCLPTATLWRMCCRLVTGFRRLRKATSGFYRYCPSTTAMA